MISFDTNVLYAASVGGNVNHLVAHTLLSDLADSPDVFVAEQVLMELYVLLRNPVVTNPPCSAAQAVSVVDSYRRNPKWAVVDVPADGTVMKAVWGRAGGRLFAAKRIFAVRLAETLRHYGVDTFYTRNVRDFKDAGFGKLINPFEEIRPEDSLA